MPARDGLEEFPSAPAIELLLPTDPLSSYYN
jgi:hypothetical protein